MPSPAPQNSAERVRKFLDVFYMSGDNGPVRELPAFPGRDYRPGATLQAVDLEVLLQVLQMQAALLEKAVSRDV